MKYLIFLIALSTSLYAQLTCNQIKENLDSLNTAQLNIIHESFEDQESSDEYKKLQSKSISQYIKLLSSEETSIESKRVINQILREISSQKESKQIQKIQRYYSQKFVQKQCDNDVFEGKQSYSKIVCDNILSVLNQGEVESLGNDIGNIISALAIKNNLVTEDEIYKMCKRSKTNSVISKSCADAGKPAQCPKKMELIAKTCMPVCSLTQIREEKAPYACKVNASLQAQEKQRKLRNKAGWNKVGKVAAVVGIAGGAVMLGAWGISKIFPPRDKVITHQYTRDYNYNYQYKYKYPQYQQYYPYMGSNLYQYGLYPSYGQTSNTSYWNETDVYSFGF